MRGKGNVSLLCFLVWCFWCYEVLMLLWYLVQTYGDDAIIVRLCGAYVVPLLFVVSWWYFGVYLVPLLCLCILVVLWCLGA